MLLKYVPPCPIPFTLPPVPCESGGAFAWIAGRVTNLRRTPAVKTKHALQSKRLWLSAVLLAVLACGVWFGAGPAKKYYHQWREKRHFERASAYFAKGDYKHAILDARNTLAFNWDNVEALRIMA